MLQFFTIVTGKLPYAKWGNGRSAPLPLPLPRHALSHPHAKKGERGGGGAIHPNKC